MKKNNIVITDSDRRRLGTMIERASRYGLAGRNAVDDLEVELERATAIDPSDCPADIVTMNSTVRLRDLERNAVETCKLVYPADANGEKNHISVLSPLGTAIIGYRVGDEIEWSVPNFEARFRVEDVIRQA